MQLFRRCSCWVTITDYFFLDASRSSPHQLKPLTALNKIGYTFGQKANGFSSSNRIVVNKKCVCVCELSS